MPRANATAIQNNFTKGLITEATGLNFPENASTDANNVVFNRIGAAERRLGFDFEDSHSNYAVTLTGNVITSYQWLNVAGSGNVAFAVVQVGNNLHFYNVSGSASLSASKHATVIDLTTFCPSGITTVSTIECQFSSGNGLLFVTNPNLDSFYVTYDIAANTLTTTAITLQIRDIIDGDTADALAIDARPAVAIGGMTAAHRYNLQNQGWDATTLASWDTARADMPSNCDVNWYFKSAAGAFDFTIVANRAVGNSAAPKGHYIYSVYNINRSSNFSGATDTAIDTSRVSTSAFFAGRVFYSGLSSPQQGGKIFFTQIIEGNNSAQYGKCYQVNDPTSEQLSDLLATDGGLINIIDAGTIIKMVSAAQVLFVFATNGVWAITGSTGTGFVANDYSINKISDIRCPSHTSFVMVEGRPFWWNLNGIWSVKTDPQTNNPMVYSITDTTIKTLFIDIPVESKTFARGAYNSLTKEIFWIYKSTSSESFEDRYIYDSFIVYSMITGGFYLWTVSSDNVSINSLVEINGIADSFSQFTVADSAVTVQDGGTDVVVFLSSTDALNSVVKYFCTFTSSGTQSTFGECFNDAYIDWYTFDSIGQTYDSYFVTGYKLDGQGLKKFQQNYINIFSNNSVDSSFKIRGIWDFSTSGNSGRWSTQQVITNTTDNFSNKNNRIKIRGGGLTCQYRVENNGNDPFNIIGWAIFETGNKWP